MITANEIKFFRNLKDKSCRDAQRMFVAETPKVVADLIYKGAKVKIVYVLHEKLIAWKYKFSDIDFVGVSDKELSRISNLKQANEVCAIFNFPGEKTFHQGDFTIALDSINDPGNMGTILRSAHWFGIKNIVCTKNCVDIYNPKVVQSTMGSIAEVNVFYSELDDFISLFSKDTTFWGASMDGESIYATKIIFPLVVVIGSEAHGICDLAKIVKKHISIPPQTPNCMPESLNAAVAASVIMSVVAQKKLN